LTTLYRFYDADERLLYVGIAGSVTNRWESHRRSFWWCDASTVKLQHFATRKEALAAEKTAIRDDSPLINRMHAKSAPPRNYRGTAWEHLAEHIRSQIRSGQYQPGGPLPSYRELGEQHHISYGTLRQAVTVLKVQGWIEGEPGVLGMSMAGMTASMPEAREDREA
jgi:excinuclease UvrABC nuclease subunit